MGQAYYNAYHFPHSFFYQVCYPSVSVFKGYSMQKETEKYLSSKGLKNAGLYRLKPLTPK